MYVNDVVLTVVESSCGCPPEKRNPKISKDCDCSIFPHTVLYRGNKYLNAAVSHSFSNLSVNSALRPLPHERCRGGGLSTPQWFAGTSEAYLAERAQGPPCQAAPTQSLASVQALPDAGVLSHSSASWLSVHTYSSSVMDSWQLSQTLTSNSNPISGMEERLELHLPHTAFPHFRQWCCRRQHMERHLQPQIQITAQVPVALPSHYSKTQPRLQQTGKWLFQGRWRITGKDFRINGEGNQKI